MTALAARGLTNEEIAVHMVVSPFTAKTHISRAMTKLGARDRAQLVVFAYESGLAEARRLPGTRPPPDRSDRFRGDRRGPLWRGGRSRDILMSSNVADVERSTR